MKKYSKTLLTVIAIGLFLGTQTAKADILPHNTDDGRVAPIENTSDQPIRIRVAYIGETHWPGTGCTLCPNWYPIQPHSTFTIPVLARWVTNIEIFDKDDRKSYGWTNDLDKIGPDGVAKLVFDGQTIKAHKWGSLHDIRNY